MFDAKAFFATVRDHFGSLSQEQVDGFNSTIDALTEQDVGLNQSAYIFATFWHETGGTMQPVTEYGSRSYIESRYDPVKGSTVARRNRAVRMGNKCAGDGWTYRGRGPVQATWKTNYRKLGELIGLGADYAEEHPEFMLDPRYAYKASVMGMLEGVFTGARLSQYVTNTSADFVRARRVVNGSDRAKDIAAYANVFRKALLKASGKL